MTVAQHQDPESRPRFVVGIDASRNRSGGSKVHLVGILGSIDPREHGIDEVHVWSYKSLLDSLPDRPWLVKHNPPHLEELLVRQVLWQRFALPKEARKAGCAILLNTDAGTVCRFRPAVVMSRDMMSYEPGEMSRFGVSKARLRLILLRVIQNRSLSFADGAIFLTDYASRVIQKASGRVRRVAIIPHGVGESFRRTSPERPWPAAGERPIECLYVSNTAMHKHQWMVVKAFAELRRRGCGVALTLAGGGSGRPQRLLAEELERSDPRQEFVRDVGLVRHEDLPARLAAADLFVFASSCENMPNTLVEAMAAGLPIACSDRGPMPEVLRDGGVYFDPENPDSIADAVQRIISDSQLRVAVARRARQLASQYSWSRCAAETWAFLRSTASIHNL